MKHRDPDAVIEDLEFLDSTNVGAKEAAQRTGFGSPHAMEKWLGRHGRNDLWRRMKGRDPVGIHEERKKPEAEQRIDPLAALLSVAAASPRSRTRKKGERIADLVADLRSTLAAEKEEDERKEEARKEVERLQRELAKAKERLRGTASTSTDSDVPASVVRAWAKQAGVACPAAGRVPQSVRDAYVAAHEAVPA